MKNNMILVMAVFSCIVLLSGVVCASDVVDDAGVAVDECYVSDDADVDVVSDDVTVEKELVKDYRDSTKTASSNVDVFSYNELVEQVDNAKNSNVTTYTINLQPGDYNATANMTLGERYESSKGKTLVINGNNITLDGKNKHMFIEVLYKDFALKLNNISITNFRDAITSYGGTLSVVGCSFDNNSGTYNGATIRTMYTLVDVVNCSFVNNSGSNGPAIFGDDMKNLSVVGCSFVNNSAKSNGGAIYACSFYYANYSFVSCSFVNNSARGGGAIYSYGGTLTVDSNIFVNNSAPNGSIIYLKYYTNRTRNINFINNSGLSLDDIYGISYGTKLIIDDILNVMYRDAVNITGRVTDLENNGIYNLPIIVNLNGLKTKVYTDKNGLFSVLFNATTVGLNRLKVEYRGNHMYNASSANKTFNVSKAETVINVRDISSVVHRDTLNVSGVVSNIYGMKFNKAKIYVIFNDVKKYVYTDKNGKFSALFVANNTGIKTLKIIYTGNTRYNSSTIIKRIAVLRRQPKILLEPVRSVNVNENIVIAGRFTDWSNTSFNHVNIFVTINGIEKHLMTEHGLFNYTIPATIKGVNNITVAYKGNVNYVTTCVITTVKVL